MAPAEASPPASTGVSVEVVHSPAPRQVSRTPLTLPRGATVRDALLASGLWAGSGDAPAAGIWGRRAPLDTTLREGDRVEIYRALVVDPKEARRQRYRVQGEKLPKGIHRPKDRTVDMTQPPAGGKVKAGA